MSKNIIVDMQGVGKKYARVSSASAGYSTIRDSWKSWIKSPFSSNSNSRDEFWALSDINLKVAEGDVLGVIGRNGAGKSTLLKLISRISPPTKGRIIVNGRVASLLEVGTGFHMELSGRENIYLNGAILGMNKREISKKLDEIIDFSGVDTFIDTPVKHYSSGMFVRLAFAVAAHLEQELLLIDEVLAVGDTSFQQRCIGKIQNISREQGRTVLFVSHNNAAVANLCNRGVVLADGGVVYDGGAHEALSFYNKSLATHNLTVSGNVDRPHIVSVMLDESALMKGSLRVLVKFASPRELDPILVGVVVHTLFGAPIFGFNTVMDQNFTPEPLREGQAILEVEAPPLHTGSYKMSVWFGEKNENFDVQHDVLSFDFIGRQPLPPGVSLEIAGPIAVNGRWSVKS